MPPRRPEYTGSYPAEQRRLIRWAYANPSTARCVKCLRLFAELPAHESGRRPWWCAGHVLRGVRNSPLHLECSHCSNAEPHRSTAPPRSPSEDPY